MYMKNYLLSFILLASLSLSSQAPQLMNYQAVVRNASGAILQNQLVNVEYLILDGSPTGPVVFTETDTVTTDQFGLIAHFIGSNADLSVVAWGSGSKYLQVQIDVTGGNNFTNMGVSQLVSVPYALYSGNGYYTYTVTLNDSQIKNLANVQQYITPAPPAGSYIIPISITSKFTGTYGYTGTYGSTQLLYLGSGTLALDSITLLHANSIRNNNSLLSTDLLPNVPLALTVASGSNPTGGAPGNTLKITTIYAIGN